MSYLHFLILTYLLIYGSPYYYGDKAYDNFFKKNVQSAADLPNWHQTMLAANQPTKISLKMAAQIPYFGKGLGDNIFNSNEYNYVLRDLKPTISLNKQDSLTLTANYGEGVNLSVKRPAHCQYKTTTSETSSAGLLTQIFTLGIADRVHRTYNHYRCRASEQDIAWLKQVESRLSNQIKATASLSGGWDYADQTSSRLGSSASASSSSRTRATDYRVVSVKYEKMPLSPAYNNYEVICLPKGNKVWFNLPAEKTLTSSEAISNCNRLSAY